MRLTLQTWILGVTETPLEDIISGAKIDWKWVKNPWKDRWFADPFILEVTPTEYIILAEEFCDKLKKGRIAQITIDRNSMTMINYKIILELPTHLSFPVITRVNGKIYVHPENSASEGHYIYNYDETCQQLSNSKKICDQPLTDAIDFEHLGVHYLLATKIPEQNSNKLLILEDNMGRFEIKKEICFESNIARMAGNIFSVNNRTYRPAQDCNRSYGNAVVIQEMSYEDNSWSFKDVLRLESTNPRFNTGLHTFNTYKGTTIIDIHGYRNPILAHAFLKIDALKERIKKMFHLNGY